MTETTIFVSVRYRNRNPNWQKLLADTVTNKKTTFQRENLVTDSTRYFFFIIRGPLKPNFLLNIRYFYNIFEGLGLFSAYKKLDSPKKEEKKKKNLKKKFKNFHVFLLPRGI